MVVRVQDGLVLLRALVSLSPEGEIGGGEEDGRGVRGGAGNREKVKLSGLECNM